MTLTIQPLLQQKITYSKPLLVGRTDKSQTSFKGQELNDSSVLDTNLIKDFCIAMAFICAAVAGLTLFHGFGLNLGNSWFARCIETGNKTYAIRAVLTGLSIAGLGLVCDHQFKGKSVR